MWSSNLFSASGCFPHFSWFRFFRAQVFQCPGFTGSRSKVWVQVLEVAFSNKFYNTTSMCVPINAISYFKDFNLELNKFFNTTSVTNCIQQHKRKQNCAAVISATFSLLHLQRFAQPVQNRYKVDSICKEVSMSTFVFLILYWLPSYDKKIDNITWNFGQKSVLKNAVNTLPYLINTKSWNKKTCLFALLDFPLQQTPSIATS